MLASVIIEYSVKSLNKVFDYIVPDNMKDIIRVGHKVMIPFASKEVEGFVLKIHNSKAKDLEYKSIIRICDSDFYLNKELLELGKYMSNSLLCNLISCYQVMLPKALKAKQGNVINKKFDTFYYLGDVDITITIGIGNEPMTVHVDVDGTFTTSPILINSTTDYNITAVYDGNNTYVGDDDKKDIEVKIRPIPTVLTITSAEVSINETRKRKKEF